MLIRNSHHLFNSLTGYPAGYPVIRPAGYPAGYPANETGYPAGYRISKKAGYPAGYPASRISGTTLIYIGTDPRRGGKKVYLSVSYNLIVNQRETTKNKLFEVTQTIC